MDAKKIMQQDDQYVMHTYKRNELVLASGQGMTAQDPEGNEYLDFTSGIGVNCLGYCDPDWAAAVAKQAATLQHTSNLFYTEPCAALAEKLCKATGFDKVFFGNSGAEANEGAIKAARKYSYDKYGAERNVVVSLVNSFHGRTMATLTATGQEVFHNYFGPFNEGFVYVPANDIEALKAALEGNKVCAVMMEMVQGEGGVMALDKAYVTEAVELCHKNDVLVIVDEVQTGMGRTGTLFAYQQFGFMPDIISMAKGLGGGLPIGGVAVSKAVAAGMGPSSHGSTFGGNPVVCAGANVVMDKLLAPGFLQNVNERAAQLRAGLAKLPHVAEVSGLGLMVGIAFEEPIKAADVLAAARKKGLLCLTAKTRLRLLPPLILTEADVEKALKILGEVLAEA